MSVDKLRISALHSSWLTATYISTSHSPLVARLDLHNFSAGHLSIVFFNSLLTPARQELANTMKASPRQNVRRPHVAARPLVLAAILLFVLTGCDSIARPGAADTLEKSGLEADQQVFFEVDYQNNAWGFMWRGFYVDADGGVWQYGDSLSVDKTGQSDAYSLEELMEKYSTQRERIGTVDEDELREMAGLIPSAARGRVTEPVGRCADFGVITLHAFEYDAGDGLYHPVLLYQAGDMARENTSESARRLTEFLMAIGQYEMTMCLP